MMDLLSTIQQDTKLKKVSSTRTRGPEYHGPCPFCGGKDRFRAQPEQDFWACRQCGRSGDLIAYLVESGRITKAEAYQARRGDAPAVMPGRATMTPPLPTLPDVATPPGAAWQARAWELTTQYQEALWDATNPRALAWLEGRGLTRETIQRAGLGYNSTDVHENYTAWGLPEKHDDHGNPLQVWLPRGVVIPWFVGPDLWRLNIRRPTGKPKYIGPAGFGNGLYNADQLTPGKPAIMVEGEFDALLIEQTAGDLITPVATGSTEGARRARWLALLALCSVVLVAFDNDQAGEKARRWWLERLPGAYYWRPYWGDASTMAGDGVSLRSWLCAGLTLAKGR